MNQIEFEHGRLNGTIRKSQYLEIRFSKSVRDIVSTASVLYAILYMPITLYLPSLAFAEGKFI